MKFWLTSWRLLNYSNHHRPILSHTLHTRYFNRFLLSCSYYPRRQLRLNSPLPTRKWCLHILYLPLSTYRPRLILRILPLSKDLKCWCHPTTYNHSHSIHRLCPPMRPNIILRGHSNYKPPISHPLHWIQHCRMSLRWLFSRQSYPYTIFYLSLYSTLYYCSSSSCPSLVSA